jgi:hypothetical protein
MPDTAFGTRASGCGKKNAIFEPFIQCKNASFYQDRLGTNIGKNSKESGVFRRAPMDSYNQETNSDGRQKMSLTIEGVSEERIIRSCGRKCAAA